MNGRLITFVACFLISFSFCSLAATEEETTEKPDNAPYDFDWHNEKDMSGAWFMCGMEQFKGGECPKVWRRCHTDPRLLYYTWKGVKMKCLNLYSFFSNKADAEETIKVADEEAGANVLDTTDADDIVFSEDNATINGLEITTAEQKEEYRQIVDEDFDLTQREAVRASEGVFNSDYSKFYYKGDGNGNGGWGHPAYKYVEYSNDIYTGELPNDTYSRVWDENYVRPNYENRVSIHMPRSMYIPITPDMTKAEKEVINRKNDVLRAKYRTEKIAVNRGIDARNAILRNREATRVDRIARAARDVSQQRLDDAYAAWRSNQEWSQYGYKQDKYRSKYNEDRVKIFFDGFVAAEDSCNGCGYAGGQEAIKDVVILLSPWGSDD